ncbi:hypothetical protein QYF36_005957 [Acer negundo]|nr:hypothetical protein QYF36_005957 [Acer negundo]
MNWQKVNEKKQLNWGSVVGLRKGRELEALFRTMQSVENEVVRVAKVKPHCDHDLLTQLNPKLKLLGRKLEKEEYAVLQEKILGIWIIHATGNSKCLRRNNSCLVCKSVALGLDTCGFSNREHIWTPYCHASIVAYGWKLCTLTYDASTNTTAASRPQAHKRKSGSYGRRNAGSSS